jgi:hypothetical protein
MARRGRTLRRGALGAVVSAAAEYHCAARSVQVNVATGDGLVRLAARCALPLRCLDPGRVDYFLAGCGPSRDCYGQTTVFGLGGAASSMHLGAGCCCWTTWLELGPRELSTKRGQGYSSLSWLRAHQSDQSLKSCNAASHTGASQNYCKTTVLNQCSKRMMDRRLARVQPSEQSRSMRGRHVLISKISVFSPYQLQGKRSPMPSASDDLAAHLAGSAMAERYC